MKEVFLLKNRQLKRLLLNTLENNLEDIAKYSKFKVRNSGKLSPESFLWLNCFSNLNLCTSTLEELCASLSFHKDINISPQALDQRIKGSSVEFIKNIFLHLCKNQIQNSIKAFKSWGFSKIFLMDSTEIKLPEKLKKVYGGTNKCNPSVLKINLLMELLNYSIENTVLAEGKRNEQNFSEYVYKKLDIDSLVLKDLGYFKFSDFDEIESRNSFFISRLKSGTRLFILNPNPKYSQKGNILKNTKYLVTSAGELGKDLRKGETKEYEFLIGSHDVKSPFRIVLTKMDEKFSVNKLKRIEESERRGECCSTLARNSMEISGYITNLWSFEPLEIIEIYRLRWQIELLFKIFKSDFKLDKLRNLSIERIETHIYATLIRVILLLEITKEIKDGYPEEVSIRRVIKSSSEILTDFINTLKDEEKFLRLSLKIEGILNSKLKKVPSKN